MAARLEVLGPVFDHELRATTRRWTTYFTRALFVLGLLAAMFVTWQGQVADTAAPTTIRGQAAVGEYYFYALVGTQLALVMLAAPAATAGALCQDKARGTLAHMLLTDLSDREIVLGKLAARLAPVVGLAACALPVLSLGTLLGGIDPDAMLMAFGITLAVGVLGCSISLALSVWGKKTNEVLMGTYAIWVLILLIEPTWWGLSFSRIGLGGPPRWLKLTNPFWLAFVPYLSPGRVGGFEYATYFTATFGAAAALAGLAVAKMRPVMLRQAGGSKAGKRRPERIGPIGRLTRALPGPTLDGNPVLWREWHRNRPSRWSRLIWLAFATGSTVASVWGIVLLWTEGVSFNTPGRIAVMTNVFQVALGLLLLSTSAPTSLAEERARGTLDVLLTTPLSTRSIVWGKWWGTFRIVPLLAIWPTLIMASFAFGWRPPPPPMTPPGWYRPIGTTTGLFAVGLYAASFLAHGAAITSLGLALATWCRRQGRAAALCVGGYVLIAVGWIFLVMTASPRTNDIAGGMASLSPIFATGQLTEELMNNRRLAEALGWLVLWLIVVSGAAVVLWLAAWQSFDRCLGRVTDWAGEFLVESPDDPYFIRSARGPFAPADVIKPVAAGEV